MLPAPFDILPRSPCSSITMDGSAVRGRTDRRTDRPTFRGIFCVLSMATATLQTGTFERYLH